jgi:hypothetical protein
MSTIKLSTGEWPVNEITSDVWAEFFMRHPSPKKPYLTKEVLGGEVEKITPPDDHPAWDEFNTAIQQFYSAARQFEWLKGFARVDVPKDWKLSDGDLLALDLQHEDYQDNPRLRKLLYIQHHVLATMEDTVKFKEAINGTITEAERAAGAEKFPGDAGETTG